LIIYRPIIGILSNRVLIGSLSPPTLRQNRFNLSILVFELLERQELDAFNFFTKKGANVCGLDNPGAFLKQDNCTRLWQMV
jgi:hypothetical protein